ncbi:MAG TPA: extracellular solute-binding protein [Bacteroidota bacterium]|nr:extracellular solute-binding protein [Bacteroidota bacterium]
MTVALCLVASACSHGPQKTPLLIYSPHGKDLLSAFETEFEHEHPTIDVQWLDMGAQDVYERIRTERNNPQADVWWGGPMTTFERAAQESLLEAYRPTWADKIPPEAKGTGDSWYGTFYTPEVIMFNKDMVADSAAPSDWNELLDRRWKGKIILRSPPASGTMRVIFCALVQREITRTGDSTAGFLWLRKLDRNTKTYVADPTQLYLRIARQEAPISVWDMPDVEFQIHRNHDPFAYHMPASGTPVLVEGIAIVRGSPHPEAARAFYEFVTSKSSILEQARNFYRVPVRMDIPSDSLPSWITAHPWKRMPVDWRELSQHEQSWMQYWDEHVKGTGTSLPPDS